MNLLKTFSLMMLLSCSICVFGKTVPDSPKTPCDKASGESRPNDKNCYCNGVKFNPDKEQCKESRLQGYTDNQKLDTLKYDVESFLITIDTYKKAGQLPATGVSGLEAILRRIKQQRDFLVRVHVNVDERRLEKDIERINDVCEKPTQKKACTEALDDLKSRISSLNQRLVDIGKKGAGYLIEGSH